MLPAEKCGDLLPRRTRWEVVRTPYGRQPDAGVEETQPGIAAVPLPQPCIIMLQGGTTRRRGLPLMPMSGRVALGSGLVSPHLTQSVCLWRGSAGGGDFATWVTLVRRSIAE